jgi:hypothetical protein
MSNDAARYRGRDGPLVANPIPLALAVWISCSARSSNDKLEF